MNDIKLNTSYECFWCGRSSVSQEPECSCEIRHNICHGIIVSLAISIVVFLSIVIIYSLWR